LFYGLLSISEEKCKGHFPTRPIVPLIRICETVAQTGVVLVACNTGPMQVPIAVGAGEAKALTRTFIEPPVSLLIVVQLKEQKFGSLFVLDSRIFVGDEEVGQLKGIKYLCPARDKVVSSADKPESSP
jgi:3-hydroxymyristoyl/3-hydroxydecanoyl-(acyl carrier protein) dehydratase